MLLFSGLRLGSRAWEAVEKTSDQIAGLRLADGFLRRTMGQMRAASVMIDGAKVQVFGGDAERLDFPAPLSERVGISGLYALHLGVESRGTEAELVLTRWYLHPEVLAGGNDFPAWEPMTKDQTVAVADLPADLDAADGAFGRTLLLKDVSLFELAYYGQLEADTEPGWHDDWLEQTQLPTLIRIRLATSKQSWPDIILALPSQPQ